METIEFLISLMQYGIIPAGFITFCVVMFLLPYFGKSLKLCIESLCDCAYKIAETFEKICSIRNRKK